MSLNPVKAIGSNSIPTKILKLLIRVSSQLTEIINPFFTHGVFSLMLKTSKLKSYLFIKKNLMCSALITGQYLYHLLLIKCSKDLYIVSFTAF